MNNIPGTPISSCLACQATELTQFYRHEGAPQNSMLLLDSAEEATSFPRGTVSLAVCHSCGFIANTEYQPGTAEYSNRYESSQAFSGTFNQFATGLAQRWIDRHGLVNKTILEIGCDKGDFLSLMCELGDNNGIGIDPAADPTRQQRSGAAGRMEFIADFYGAKYQDVFADVVICRHTLEHIPNVLEFMTGVRDALGDRLETVVLFELPDTKRVLEDGAFWDIYYEHCSYFTAGSLARLFRRTGFEVISVEREFDDQYLLIEARPCNRDVTTALSSASTPTELEEVAAQVVESSLAFGASAHEDIRIRKEDLNSLHRDGKRLVVWGGGSKGVAFLTTLGLNEQVKFAVDVNPHKQGQYLSGFGQLVIGPADLVGIDPHVIVVMNPIYLDEINASVAQLGLHANVFSVDQSVLSR
jgi:SAM-dependent methyltransferase